MGLGAFRTGASQNIQIANGSRTLEDPEPKRPQDPKYPEPKRTQELKGPGAPKVPGTYNIQDSRKIGILEKGK